MKLRIDRREFAEAAAWVALATPRGVAPHPEMSGLRLTADGDTLRLDGYNYETAHTATLGTLNGVDIITPGEALVSAKTLVSIVAALNVDTIELVAEERRLVVTAGKSTYRLGLMLVDRFPALPATPAPSATFEAENLSHVLHAVATSAADKNSPIESLKGIHLICDGRTLIAEATDRFRAARTQVATAKRGKKFTALVPADLITASVKALAGRLEVGVTDNLIGVAQTDGSRVITSRLLAEEYPTLDALFTVEPKVTAVLNAPDLAEAIKRVLVVSEQQARIRLAFSKGDAEVAVTADSESGDGAEYVLADVSKDIEFIFNGTHLGHALATTAGDVTFGATTPTQAVAITPTDESADRFVVMPRRSLTS